MSSADEMSVSPLVMVASNVAAPAAKCAAAYDKFPAGKASFKVQNLWRVAHVGAHLLLQANAEILKEEACAPVGDQESLFEVPVDHAMVVREVVALLRGIEERLVGAAERWELRVAAESTPTGPPDLAHAVSTNLYTATGPVTFAELEAHFGDADGVRAALDWLVSQGKITETDAGYSPAGGELNGVAGDELRQLYESEVGKKPGKKSEESLRAAILDARRAAAGA